METGHRLPVRIGVVGFGRMGAIHARNVSLATEARLVVICDRDPVARTRAAAAHQVKTVPSVEELLECDLDAVIVASSTQEHAGHVTSCADAGLGVFTEKPVGLSGYEAEATMRAVERAGVPFQIGFQRRWDAEYLRMKGLIDAGTIGTPVLFKAHGRDPNASARRNWGLDKNGGLFANCAIHDFDTARFMFGREATTVTASGNTLVHKGLMDFGDIDICSTVLEFEGGGMAITEWSRFASYGYDVRAEMVGTDGIVQIGSEERLGLSVRLRTASGFTVFERFASAYRASIEGFIGAVQGGHTPSPGVLDARAALNIAERARESYAAGSTKLTVANEINGAHLSVSE